MGLEKEQVSKWLKNPYTVSLIAILVLSLVVRFYFLPSTLSQPLWWDEAEYMLKAKSFALNTPAKGWYAGRPILFPVLLSIPFFLGLGEGFIRFSLVLLSVASVLLVYLVGKQIFNKKIALLASFFFSFFYVIMFYTFRIMVDVPSMFLGLLGFYFFFHKNRKLTWFFIPSLVLATLLRFPSFFFFAILFIYIVFTENKWWKNKDYYISAVIGFLIALPYLLWSYFEYGHPLHAVIVGGTGSLSAPEVGRFGVFMQYITYLPNYAGWILFGLFIVGLIYALTFLLGLDMLKKDKSIKRNFLMILWLVIPLIYFGFFVNHFEDRYIFMIFPAFFYLASNAVFKISGTIKKYNTNAPLIFITVILLLGFYTLTSHSASIISSRATSFTDLRQAGKWIKENSAPDDVVYSSGTPQNVYYSERSTLPYPENQEEFEQEIRENNPKYMIITMLEKSPDWVYSWPQQNNESLKLAKFYQRDNQISTVIYEFIN